MEPMQHSTINRQASIDNNHLSIFNIQSKAGFTLIELLIVIVIMMFLAGITVPIVSSIQTNAKKGVTSAQISQLGIALKQFESDFGVFPPDSYTLSDTAITIGGIAIPRDDDLSSGTNSKSRCLVFFLGSKFIFSSTNFTATYGPYIEFKRSQLSQVSGADFSDGETISYISVDGINGLSNVYEYKDPFGTNNYSYDSSSPSNNTASFDIYSYGPDKNNDFGVSTSDDITNW
jgi:prepilin-type N-terminal cleavage/methylation domain-containing protein